MIYFIQEGDDGPIKIGYTAPDSAPSDHVRSTSAVRRIKAMQTGNSRKLQQLAVIDGSLAMEKQLHSKFRRSSIRGEWFRPSRKLLDFIQGITEDQMRRQVQKEFKETMDLLNRDARHWYDLDSVIRSLLGKKEDACRRLVGERVWVAYNFHDKESEPYWTTIIGIELFRREYIQVGSERVFLKTDGSHGATVYDPKGRLQTHNAICLRLSRRIA